MYVIMLPNNYQKIVGVYFSSYKSVKTPHRKLDNVPLSNLSAQTGSTLTGAAYIIIFT